MSFPKKLNIGSGKDFRDDYLNMDYNEYWEPDFIFDLNTPLFPKGKPAKFKTQRFGEITIEPNTFDEIMCNDVVEHIPDLVTAMTSCLQILRVGGVFNIKVPYDLSVEAWQDPTHIRAFNERSWVYYCEWFWYLGWTEHRFKTNSINFSLSPVGQQLQQQGTPNDVLLRTPRAVTEMQVQLEKMDLTPEDKINLEGFRGRKRK